MMKALLLLCAIVVAYTSAEYTCFPSGATAVNITAQITLTTSPVTSYEIFQPPGHAGSLVALTDSLGNAMIYNIVEGEITESFTYTFFPSSCSKSSLSPMAVQPFMVNDTSIGVTFSHSCSNNGYYQQYLVSLPLTGPWEEYSLVKLPMTQYVSAYKQFFASGYQDVFVMVISPTTLQWVGVDGTYYRSYTYAASTSAKCFFQAAGDMLYAACYVGSQFTMVEVQGISMTSISNTWTTKVDIARNTTFDITASPFLALVGTTTSLLMYPIAATSDKQNFVVAAVSPHDGKTQWETVAKRVIDNRQSQFQDPLTLSYSDSSQTTVMTVLHAQSGKPVDSVVVTLPLGTIVADSCYRILNYPGMNGFYGLDISKGKGQATWYFTNEYFNLHQSLKVKTMPVHSASPNGAAAVFYQATLPSLGPLQFIQLGN